MEQFSELKYEKKNNHIIIFNIFIDINVFLFFHNGHFSDRYIINSLD